MNGILWIARSGAVWRDLPERYGAWQTVYKRFVQWQEAGLLERIFHDLGADADLQDISIDSTYIKANKASAGAAKKGKAIPKTNAKTNAPESAAVDAARKFMRSLTHWGTQFMSNFQPERA